MAVSDVWKRATPAAISTGARNRPRPRPAFVANLYGTARYATIAGVLGFTVTLARVTRRLAGAAYGAPGRYDPIRCALVVVSAGKPVPAAGQASRSGVWLDSRARSLEQRRARLQEAPTGGEFTAVSDANADVVMSMRVGSHGGAF
jgi:hypothetical protein